MNAEHPVLSYYLNMSGRPKHSTIRPDYRQLLDIKVPKTARRSCRSNKANSLMDSKLYRLRVLEEDEENGRVKVGYIGFSDEYDEWRRMEDIVIIEEKEKELDNDYLAPSRLKFCLTEELACRIKSLLFSSRFYSVVEKLVLFVP